MKDVMDIENNSIDRNCPWQRRKHCDKIKQERQIVARYARLTPSCNHPRNFIAIASLILEICTRQNSSMKINKGQYLEN